MLTECTPLAREAPENPQIYGPSCLVDNRLQGWGIALPRDFPALEPKHSLFARGPPGKDPNDEVLAGTKELKRDAKAQNRRESRLQGERSFPAAEGADAVMEGGLVPLAFALDANGNPHKDEATVGRELTGLLPVLLYS